MFSPCLKSPPQGYGDFNLAASGFWNTVQPCYVVSLKWIPFTVKQYRKLMKNATK